MLEILIWILIFIAALFVLVKGADYVVENAERIGVSWNLSPFLIGVTIVGIGTSLPELVTAIVAMAKDAGEIVVANAVGSNIANILVVLGVAAIITRNLHFDKSLIYLDIPILLTATLLFLGTAIGREMLPSGASTFAVNFGESIFLISAYIAYLIYSFSHNNDYAERLAQKIRTPHVNIYNYILFAVGVLGVIIGAKYAVDAVLNLSALFGIGVGIITILAVALGTSLPELFVSVRAARIGKPEIAVGNIFGSNMFNMLALVGIPGLFGTLIIDESTYYIGLPTLLVATLIFLISGITNKVHRWDGIMYLFVYALFAFKITGIF